MQKLHIAPSEKPIVFYNSESGRSSDSKSFWPSATPSMKKVKTCSETFEFLNLFLCILLCTHQNSKP